VTTGRFISFRNLNRESGTKATGCRCIFSTYYIFHFIIDNFFIFIKSIIFTIAFVKGTIAEYYLVFLAKKSFNIAKAF
jgi:hypothetical protein